MSQTTSEVATPMPQVEKTGTSNAFSLTADAFLGQWTSSIQQNVLVVRCGDDHPNVLRAILKWETKEGEKSRELMIKMDNKQWCCGNGVLVLDSNEEHPREISWARWNGGVSTWTREKSWSDVAKALQTEDSQVDAPKDADEKTCSNVESSSEKPLNCSSNGLIAGDFLGHWKWQEHDVNVSYLEGSNGRLQVTIDNRSRPLVLGLVPYHGMYYWLCGNGYLNDNIEYDVDNKQAKSLQWVYLNEKTQKIVVSKWTRVTDGDSTPKKSVWSAVGKKSVSDCDGSSTEEGTEEKDGTWYQMTKDWEVEQEQCAIKNKILNTEARKGKQEKPKAKQTALNKNAQKAYVQWAEPEWVDPRWVEVTGNKMQKAARGNQKNNQWTEVDGWKRKTRRGGRGQQNYQ